MDWKRLLKREQNEVLGLDIGSSAVKIVQMCKGSAGYAVTAAGIVNIANAAQDKNNHRVVNTTMAIRECLQLTGVQTRLAACSVCGPEVAVRYFSFPSLPLEEIEGAVLLEAGQVCPFSVDEGAVDYQLISNGGDKTSGVLVAATDKMIRAKERLVKNASLDCVLMDVDGLALLNCFSEYEPPKAGRTIAILNVGNSFTNLVIIGDNGVPFIRDMAYAGDDIVKQIAAELDVSTETVGEILSAAASGKQEQSQLEARFKRGLEKACQKLITDVTETLRYYTAQEKSTFVEKIFVCGGFALVKGFVELLDNQLPANAMLWNPFDKIGRDVDQVGRNQSLAKGYLSSYCQDVLQKNGPAMTVAAGLAMRSI